MSDDERLSIVDALRVAREQIAEQRADANNTMIDCDRTLRRIDGALQRHEGESCQTESGASQHANSADTRSPSTSTHPKAHATSAASSVDASRAVESRTAIGATAHPSAPPSEPVNVTIARDWHKRHDDPGYFGHRGVGHLLTHIDTLSARLKRAEELLSKSEVYMPLTFALRLDIVRFFAGKGEA